MAHRFTEQELKAQLAEAAKHVTVGARYAHYKNPDNTYVVKEFAILEATDEIAVIYEAQYGEGLTFIRTLSSWLETAEREGKSVPRFAEVA